MIQFVAGVVTGVFGLVLVAWWFDSRNITPETVARATSTNRKRAK